MAEAAVAYGAAGYRVHPCRNTPENKDTDKTPLTRWQEAASSHPAIIASHWARWPDALIGLCTGSGLVVVDDDRGGEEPEDDMALTRTAKTRSRGWHHYFRCSNPTVGNRVDLIPGIDVRGAGGYVIAPPSPGWAWVNPLADMLELPSWVLTLMAAQGQRRRGWGKGFEIAQSPVGEGRRNDYIARFAGYVLRLELATSLGALEVLCMEESDRICSPPLGAGEVRQTAASIWRTEQRRNA